MKKYIVESISQFRHVHIVEANSEEEAFEVAKEADDNWQEYLGATKLDVQEFTKEHAKRFREKQYWWDGSSFRKEDGTIDYQRPQK